VDQEVMMRLAMSLVVSRLDYCNAVLACLPASTIAPLQRVRNAAAWLIWCPCPEKPLWIFTYTLYFQKLRVLGLNFCWWYYRSIFIQICALGSRRRTFSATGCVSAIQGHPRSMILVPIESVYATSY